MTYINKNTVYFQPAIERLYESIKFDKILNKYSKNYDKRIIYHKSLNMLSVYYNSNTYGTPDIYIRPMKNRSNVFDLVDNAIGINILGKEYIIYLTDRKNVSILLLEIDILLQNYFRR